MAVSHIMAALIVIASSVGIFLNAQYIHRHPHDPFRSYIVSKMVILIYVLLVFVTAGFDYWIYDLPFIEWEDFRLYTRPVVLAFCLVFVYDAALRRKVK